MRSYGHLLETIYLFREIVVGFVAGLNFPRQGQRSDLSDGRVNEQGKLETVQEIESEKAGERARQKDGGKATSETELKHWCIL